jgi:hypothetical protein
MQRALNAIQMQGNSDEEEVAVEDQVQDNAVADNMRENAQQLPGVDNLMHITAAAYTGSPGASTISLLLSISGQTAIALADTGSTNTFLDYNFAVKHNIAIQPAPSCTVTVAGGGTLISEYVARNYKFSIEGKPFQADFRVLQLQGSDIILGVNWFKEHNPVTFDFVERTLSLSVDGNTYSFSDHLIPAHRLIISAEECDTSPTYP